MTTLFVFLPRYCYDNQPKRGRWAGYVESIKEEKYVLNGKLKRPLPRPMRAWDKTK
jgi:hypothetical protein